MTQPKLSITFHCTNANTAVLLMCLWELLERPGQVTSGLSNVSQPDTFEWLKDEIAQFDGVMRKIDEIEGLGVYGNDQSNS